MRRRNVDARTLALAIAGGGLGLAALGYLGYAARAWSRYGRARPRPDDSAGRSTPKDPLDDFMPTYEVAERHEIEVAAPAEVTYATARVMDINRSPLSRAIFAVRTLPARVTGHVPPRDARSLVDETQALGWRILAETPGRLLVMGAVTQPWKPNVEFRGLAPDEFRAFSAPGWAKIVWTLEAEPLEAEPLEAGPREPARSRFRTRTRVCTTDPEARAHFRRYWALVSAGIVLIRRSSLGLVKAEAERRSRARRTRRGIPGPSPSSASS